MSAFDRPGNDLKSAQQALSIIRRIPDPVMLDYLNPKDWLRRGYDLKYKNHPQAIERAYSGLASLSNEGFALVADAITAAQMDSLPREGQWRVVSESRLKDVAPLKKELKGSDPFYMECKVMMLYWLIYDEPSKRQSSPWRYDGSTWHLNWVSLKKEGFLAKYFVVIPPASKIASLTRRIDVVRK
jgi:hypothetical protein